MDVKTLVAAWNLVPDNYRPEFLRRGFSMIKAAGLTGYRAQTWWSSSVCRQNLARQCTNKPVVLSLLPKLAIADTYDDGFKGIEELQKEHGAPSEFSTDDRPGLFLTDQFAEWLADHLQQPDVCRITAENFQRFPLSYFFHAVINHSDLDSSELAILYWKVFAPVRDQFEVLTRISEHFPIPPDFLGDIAVGKGAGTDVNTPAGTPEQQSDSFGVTPDSAEQTSSGKEISTATQLPSETQSSEPTDLDRAMVFRDARTADKCAGLAKRMNERGLYSVATDYYLQLTHLVDGAQETEDAAWNYLLARAMSEGIDAKDPEVQAFITRFPESERITTLQAEIARSFESGLSYRQTCVPVKEKSGKLKDAIPESVFRKTSNSLMEADKLKAVEFLHKAIRYYPDSVILLRSLAQSLSGLGLFAAAHIHYSNIASLDSRSKGGIDAWRRAVECLIDDHRLVEAEEQITQMQNRRVNSKIIASLRKRAEMIREAPKPPQAHSEIQIEQQAVQTDDVAKPVVPSQLVTTFQPVIESEMAQMQASAEAGLIARIERIPYPRRFIGTIYHRYGYINFCPKYVLVSEDAMIETKTDA